MCHGVPVKGKVFQVGPSAPSPIPLHHGLLPPVITEQATELTVKATTDPQSHLTAVCLAREKERESMSERGRRKREIWGIGGGEDPGVEETARETGKR